MSPIFKALNEKEYQLLVDAIPLITILIAGSDGQLDLKEKAWAEKITKIRSYSHHFDLKPLYKDIDSVFKDRYDDLVGSLPQDPESRNEKISHQLNALNAIFSKLPFRTAGQLYSGYLSFAEEVAKASGGFLRFLSINQDESMWIGLPMLDPIFYDELEEEE